MIRVPVEDVRVPDAQKVQLESWLASLHGKQDAQEVVAFKPYQLETIHLVLKGDNVFSLVKTGGGKTLMYALAGLVDSGSPNVDGVRPAGKCGATVVISPVLNLVRNQLAGLKKMASNLCDTAFAGESKEWREQYVQHSAAALTGEVEKGDRCEGDGDELRRIFLPKDDPKRLRVLLMTPEKWVSPAVRLMIYGITDGPGRVQKEQKKVSARIRGRLRTLVLDEAHCASTLSVGFRETYFGFIWNGRMVSCGLHR